MSMHKVRAALAQAFVNGAFFPSADVGWDNVSFTPRQGNKPWALWNFVPTQPSPETLGDTGYDRVDGFVQVDLNYPPGNGSGDAIMKYVALAAVFKAGARFTYSGQEAVIVSCGMSQGRIVDGYYRVSTTIVFYAFVQRQS